VHLPRYSPVVKVSGAVNSPSSIAFVPGEGLRYYVDAAGGLLSTGDLSHAYVVQPNGTRERYRHRRGPLLDIDPEPLAGGEIVVPAKPAEQRTFSDRAAPVMQVLTGLATLLLVVSRL
jgi:protein involved in polysaccharide export with SLBB domain